MHYLNTAGPAARLAGVKPEQIIHDPGIGFAKSAAQSVELLHALPKFVKEFGTVLLGASRKSFIAVLDEPRKPAPDDRLAGSIAAALRGAEAGCSILRVHDVAATRQALAVWRGMHTP